MESFSCSPFSLKRNEVKEFPDKLVEILFFIYNLNELTSVAQAQYCLQFNSPFPYPEIKGKHTYLPLSGYCCYVSTLVSKHFLEKFYPEFINIQVINGIYKGLGEHSWLELKWKDKNYILDTKPFFQGYPNMYNFGTPEVKKYRKKFFKTSLFLFGITKEYKMRFELARWCIHVLTHWEVWPFKKNERRVKMWNVNSINRLNQLKIEYNRDCKNKDRLELSSINLKYSDIYKR